MLICNPSQSLDFTSAWCEMSRSRSKAHLIAHRSDHTSQTILDRMGREEDSEGVCAKLTKNGGLQYKQTSTDKKDEETNPRWERDRVHS